eukprot:CAMPEP_0197444196 /NCGR_PEP_ID=MMETSP1175-20131217/9732_1 /TAXON_ID=1003142 /ORGANISM="Triceratium dubium, Strain CCMP147" /LENGTH=622 /DNA_ID=CAMNT_0042974939 /DNA_START=63 /DNA_END=1931 /DNA_ORIENTATION=-
MGGIHRQNGARPGIHGFCGDKSIRVDRKDESIEDLGGTLLQSKSFDALVKKERWVEWASSFRRSDPRYQILRFFNDVAQEGADNIETDGINPELRSPLLKAFSRASVFTVWRPTSDDAIRKMMTGEGTGKGLDVKGKSAKCGMLSGFVPFLQIHEERHKHMIRTLPREGKIRVYFGAASTRDEAAQTLGIVAKDMIQAVSRAKSALANPKAGRQIQKEAMEKLSWDMEDPNVTKINDYEESNCYGFEISERLFWEAYVIEQDISRDPSSKFDTGRPSEPSYQDMNFTAIRKYHINEKDTKEHSGPRAVLWQHPEADHPMCPRTLLMAYEENGRVVPVVSDFDCFIMGSRGVRYEKPLPPDQLSLMKWCISQTKIILDNPKNVPWTKRWLDILKENAVKGVHPVVPKCGFADPKSYCIIEHAIRRLEESGAVRHGAECFNYYFPQEIDDEFLVISDTLGPPGTVPWKKVGVSELQNLLCQKIEEGFSFPLNPKWILCDPGWRKVYDALLSSALPNVQTSVACWYPPDSGIREQIEDVLQQHPGGFPTSGIKPPSHYEGTSAMDLAELDLKHFMTVQRARRKLRGLIYWLKTYDESRQNNARWSYQLRMESGEEIEMGLDIAQV